VLETVHLPLSELKAASVELFSLNPLPLHMRVCDPPRFRPFTRLRSYEVVSMRFARTIAFPLDFKGISGVLGSPFCRFEGFPGAVPILP